MASILTAEFLANIEALHLNLVMEIKNNTAGKRRSKNIGSSVEFSDYRQYISGDDTRRIDWNTYARFERLFIKRYLEEQTIPMTIFADYSQSMSFASKKKTLLELTALFAYSQLANYDSVAVLPLNKNWQQALKYWQGRRNFYNLVQIIENSQFSGDIDLLLAVEQQVPLLKKGYSLIISDFLFDHQLDEVLSLLKYKKQEIIIIQTLSEEELNPNYTQDICLQDSENLSELNLQVSEQLMQSYQQQLQQHTAEINDLADKYAAEYFLLPSAKGIYGLLEQLEKSRLGGNYGS